MIKEGSGCSERRKGRVKEVEFLCGHASRFPDFEYCIYFVYITIFLSTSLSSPWLSSSCLAPMFNPSPGIIDSTSKISRICLLFSTTLIRKGPITACQVVFFCLAFPHIVAGDQPIKIFSKPAKVSPCPLPAHCL